MFKITYSKQALKDLKKIEKSKYLNKVLKLISIIEDNPWSEFPSYEKLTNNLAGFYSRRINAQHRLVYEVLEKEKVVRILRVWTHYGD